MGAIATAVSQGTCVGVVKWFRADKGYGFIINDAGGPELFLHYLQIIMPNAEENPYRTIDDGARVSFEVHKSAKGFEARNVRRI
jgi:cold shock protein